MKKQYIQPELNYQPINSRIGICNVGSVQGNLDISLIGSNDDPI